MVVHALEVVRPLEHGDVLGQIALVDAAERAQEVAQPRPDALHGVAMGFADAVAVVVAGVLARRVAHRPVSAPAGFDPVVGGRLVGVQHGPCGGLRLDLRLDRVLPGVVADRQADLAALPPDGAHDRRAVVRLRAAPLPLVGPSARRVFGVAVGVALLAGVLEQLVGLGHRVRQRRGVPAQQRQSLHLVAVVQQRAVVALQLVGQLQRRRPLREAAQDHHDHRAGVVGARPDRAGEQVEHRAALPAAVV